MSLALRQATASACFCWRSAASAFFWALIRALLFLDPNGRLAGHGGLVRDRGLGRTDAVHLGADGVDLGQLLGCDQALGDHRAVDELGPRVVGRRDQVATAEPGVSEEIPALGGLLDFLTRDGQIIGCVEAEGARGFLGRRGRFRFELQLCGRGLLRPCRRFDARWQDPRRRGG